MCGFISFENEVEIVDVASNDKKDVSAPKSKKSIAANIKSKGGKSKKSVKNEVKSDEEQKISKNQ